jgi:single-strand DNA-binding protein
MEKIMLNQIVLVGRLVKKPEVIKTENDKEYSNITLAVPRSYKNENGEYETDFVDCVLWNGVASQTAEYCKKGDLIGVKGRVQTSNYEKDGEVRKSMQVVAEKVTFLSSKSKENENEDIEV